MGEALIALRNEELKEMGILSVGHQITILKAVYDIKVKQEIPIEIDDYIPPCTFDATECWIRTLMLFSCRC